MNGQVLSREMNSQVLSGIMKGQVLSMQRMTLYCGIINGI